MFFDSKALDSDSLRIEVRFEPMKSTSAAELSTVTLVVAEVEAK
jgi:uncharacterized protein (DUF1684 family)